MVHSSLFAGRVSAAASTRFFDFHSLLSFFFLEISGSIFFFPPSGESFEIFPSECFVIESILLSHSDYRARSKKGIPRSVQLSVSRRCIDDHQSAQSRSKILSQQRDLEVKYSHFTRVPILSLQSCSISSKGNHVIDFHIITFLP